MSKVKEVTEVQSKMPESLKTWVSESHYVTFKGQKVFVHTSGPKSLDGRGVLIVHGFPGSSWDWKGVAAIAEDKARVVVPDMLGFGHSDKPKKGTFKDNYSLMKQADLYEAIAKEEGLTNPSLAKSAVGNSGSADSSFTNDLRFMVPDPFVDGLMDFLRFMFYSSFF